MEITFKVRASHLVKHVDGEEEDGEEGEDDDEERPQHSHRTVDLKTQCSGALVAPIECPYTKTKANQSLTKQREIGKEWKRTNDGDDDSKEEDDGEGEPDPVIAPHHRHGALHSHQHLYIKKQCYILTK